MRCEEASFPIDPRCVPPRLRHRPVPTIGFGSAVVLMYIELCTSVACVSVSFLHSKLSEDVE